jgi:dolichol-phosphate mannosyltransferase|tara:strand:- start:2250 stop:2945 length:696 start_codon:yes stop_codon:yes gene_type:complete
VFQIKQEKQKITVVIPAFNEEKTIKEIVTKAKPFCDAIIVALAKKSRDETGKIVQSLGARVITDNGKGKGDGMRCAINEIKEGIIVFIDADGSHILEDIPKILDPIRRDKADMVIGSRYLGGSEELHGDFNKFLRMFFSMCIAQIMNLRFRTSIMDTQNGFRAIKADVAKKLRLTSNHTEIETEMCMKCYKKGFKIVEVPSRELKRKFGKSNISLTRDAFKYMWAIIKNLF